MIKGGIRLVSSSREKSRVLRAGRWIGFVAFQGIWWGEAEGNFNARLRLFSSTKNYRSLLPTIEGMKLKTALQTALQPISKSIHVSSREYRREYRLFAAWRWWPGTLLYSN